MTTAMALITPKNRASSPSSAAVRNGEISQMNEILARQTAKGMAAKDHSCFLRRNSSFYKTISGAGEGSSSRNQLILRSSSSLLFILSECGVGGSGVVVDGFEVELALSEKSSSAVVMFVFTSPERSSKSPAQLLNAVAVVVVISLSRSLVVVVIG